MAIPTLEQALVLWLLSQPDIVTYVGDRIRTGVAPQNERRPFIVIGPPRIEPQYSAAGGSGLAESRVEITCEARSYAEAREIAELIRGLFADGWRGDLGGLFVHACYASLRGNHPQVIGGDQEGFRSATVELHVFHELP